MANDNPSGGGLLDSIKSGRAPLPVIGGLAALVVIGIIFVAVALGGGGGDDDDGKTAVGATPTASSGGLQTSEPTVEATIDLSRPTATAQNLTSVGPGDRLVISKFGVDAPLTYRSVGLDGVMPNPDGSDDIAYYDFSAWPGKGGAPGFGNAVFAGHVDSGSKPCKNGTVPPPCQAVLWDLNNLRVGDEIQVVVSGQTYTYAVKSNQPVSAANGPWDTIVSSTQVPSITIITCGGDFNRETREYTNRQVVVAELKA